jgi:hypothetical protein
MPLYIDLKVSINENTRTSSSETITLIRGLKCQLFFYSVLKSQGIFPGNLLAFSDFNRLTNLYTNLKP